MALQCGLSTCDRPAVFRLQPYHLLACTDHLALRAEWLITHTDAHRTLVTFVD